MGTTVGQFPVVTKRAVDVIEGHETTVLLSGYEDRIMVMVSQIGKLGTLLFAKREEIYDGPKAFQVDTILGKRDEPMLTVCARQLIEKISMAGSRWAHLPLLLSISLKDHSPAMIKGVIAFVEENRIW
ncbi:hypothetical protein CBR_g5628 [Chara braunii]|uniref:Uncharacterized protein n=1 Tax=Chara braunii TaxID=69332 RepID=A0A388JRL9_CHABU|nr:hypothetical protein CBR_g5628 [Chara braunii]|eukprot:GBG60454.1 hypothetical protein CBR_g5628 [Chara braunii]